MANVNAKTLNAIIVAFRAEMKAAKKTAEAIDAFAVECMDAGIKRADAAKALAIAVRKEMLKDPEYVAREAENGKPFTSLKAICRSIENRWTYSCNKLGSLPMKAPPRVAVKVARPNKSRRRKAQRKQTVAPLSQKLCAPVR